MDSTTNIAIGISSCLVGEKVRFNGEAKRRNAFLELLNENFSLERTCPEVGIGLGVPRETIRLVDIDGETRVRDSAGGERDHTEALNTFAQSTAAEHPHWCGYIGVKGSPSCGYARVKRYNASGSPLVSDGVGQFIVALRAQDPLLPIEEDGRLNDLGIRHSFVLRVITYSRWKQLLSDGVDAHALIGFYSQHKYLVMAHSVPHYQRIGRLLADAGKQEPSVLAAQLIGLIMEAFAKPARRQGHANALYHVSGYLKKQIDAQSRAEIRETIDQYRSGIVPMVVPVTLLRSYFKRHPDPYIEQQLFMMPFPAQLGLRNAL